MNTETWKQTKLQATSLQFFSCPLKSVRLATLMVKVWHWASAFDKQLWVHNVKGRAGSKLDTYGGKRAPLSDWPNDKTNQSHPNN